MIYIENSSIIVALQIELEFYIFLATLNLASTFTGTLEEISNRKPNIKSAIKLYGDWHRN